MVNVTGVISESWENGVGKGFDFGFSG